MPRGDLESVAPPCHLCLVLEGAPSCIGNHVTIQHLLEVHPWSGSVIFRGLSAGGGFCGETIGQGRAVWLSASQPQTHGPLAESWLEGWGGPSHHRASASVVSVNTPPQQQARGRRGGPARTSQALSAAARLSPELSMAVFLGLPLFRDNSQV